MNNAPSLRDKTNWVVVADAAAAKIYGRKGRYGLLHELYSMQNEEARRKTADLISDRGGRSFDSRGKGRHTMTNEKSNPKRHAPLVFAKEIAGHISRAKHDGSCHEFVLIAAPRFLGLLRDALSVAGNADPVDTIDKDMVGQKVDAIEKLLEK